MTVDARPYWSAPGLSSSALSSSGLSSDLPAWWTDLHRETPVVCVIDGGCGTLDFSRILRPSILALASKDCLVVVCTNGHDPGPLAMDLPDNTRLTRLLPLGSVLPFLDVLVADRDSEAAAAARSFQGEFPRVRRSQGDSRQIAASVGEALTEREHGLCLVELVIAA